MSGKNTPTPWKMGKAKGGGITIRARGDERPVAEIWANGHDMRANAALIVRAVNSRETLVDALREIDAALLISFPGGPEQAGDDLIDEEIAAWGKVRDALALAEAH